MQGLFRQEALTAQRQDDAGGILLIRPLRYHFYVLLAMLVALSIGSLLAFGSYTGRTTVYGELIPDKGLLHLYPADQAAVAQRLVNEGERVDAGQPLLLLSGDWHTESFGEVHAAVMAEIDHMLISLRDDQRRLEQRTELERRMLQDTINALESEHGALQAQIRQQRAQVELSEQALERAETLAHSGHIARTEVELQTQRLLDQRLRLSGLERELVALQREQNTQAQRLAELSLHRAGDAAELERRLAQTRQELIHVQGSRSLVIRAPEAGTVAAVLAEPGQTVGPAQPLISILPADARLQAHLYVPSSAIGFLQPGDQVRLRYHAFPHQKFGQHRATIRSLSRAPLPRGTSASPGDDGGQPGLPIYRLIAELEREHILAYGRPEPLQAGMSLEASVLRDTRRLYQWVLEPLYSIRGWVQ
jgi:membrane fusion protein